MTKIVVKFLIPGLLLLSSQAEAALAPNFQRARELTAVIEAVALAMPDKPVNRVRYIESDKYEVRAGKCSVIATLQTKPLHPGWVGPRQFDVKLAKPKCK